MTIWDEIGDLFKSKDQLQKEKEQEYNAVKKKEKQLLNKLEKLEQQYQNLLPKPVEKDYSSMFEKFDKTEKIDNTASDTMLQKEAKKEATKDYDEVISKIKNQFEKNKQTAENKKQIAKENTVSLLKNLLKEKDLQDEKVNDKMTKNGLYYSSIKDNLLGENEKNLQDNVSKAKENTYQYISKLDESIADLEKNRDNALKNYDKKTIDAYDSLLKKLTEKRDKEKQSILQYNENIKEEKVRYDNSVKKAIEGLKEKDRKKQKEEEARILEHEEKYGYTGAKKENYSKRLDLAREFYSTLPKDVALRSVKNNHDLKGYLGVYYYDLVGEISERKERTKIFS